MNIFLNSQKVAKLGDFGLICFILIQKIEINNKNLNIFINEGLSRTLNDHSFAKTSLGTPYYLSPV